jgi:cobalt-precorrin 5A hydrolase
MKVAGFGFRSAATEASLADALARAGGAAGVSALATAADKAGHPALAGLAHRLGLPVRAVALADLAGGTPAARVPARYGAQSLAEAAALAAAGPGAALAGPRAVSADRMATAALAESLR